MAKKKVDVEQTEAYVPTDPEEVLAHIIKDEDGDFRVYDCRTGETGDKCKFCDEGDRTIVLTPNSANRKWANRKKADEAIEKDGFYPMVYKATKHIGSVGTRMPNEKIIAYLPEDLQAEYKAIIDRAIAAKEEAKSKPMTDLEKAQAKLAKAKEAYEKLLAESANGNA